MKPEHRKRDAERLSGPRGRGGAVLVDLRADGAPSSAATASASVNSSANRCRRPIRTGQRQSPVSVGRSTPRDSDSANLRRTLLGSGRFGPDSSRFFGPTSTASKEHRLRCDPRTGSDRPELRPTRFAGRFRSRRAALGRWPLSNRRARLPRAFAAACQEGSHFGHGGERRLGAERPDREGADGVGESAHLRPPPA